MNMLRSNWLTGSSLILALSLAACGGGDPSSEDVDAGRRVRDTGVMDDAALADEDAGSVVDEDAGSVVDEDAGSVVGEDAGPVVGEDAGVASDGGAAVRDCDTDRPCARGQVCIPPTGTCGTAGTCTRTPVRCLPAGEEMPVCGCDGMTYDNECAATRAGQGVASTGACVISCNPAEVTCPNPTPRCMRGQVPRVVDGCWGGCTALGACSCTVNTDCPGTTALCDRTGHCVNP